MMNNAKTTWELNFGTEEYIIEFKRITLKGDVAIAINGVTQIIPYNGIWFEKLTVIIPFKIGDKSAKMYFKNKNIRLFVDGTDALTNESINDIQYNTTSNRIENEEKILKGRRSFMTLIILSMINIVLFMLNATIAFPFSLAITTILLSFGSAFDEGSSQAVFTIIAIVLSCIIILLFFVLYLFTKRNLISVWIATVLFLIDTAVLVYCATTFNYVADALVDFAFHGWALLSFYSIIKHWYMVNKVKEESFILESHPSGVE